MTVWLSTTLKKKKKKEEEISPKNQEGEGGQKMNKKRIEKSIPTQPPFVKSDAEGDLISSQTCMTFSRNDERFEMVCMQCGLLQPGWKESLPNGNGETVKVRTEYCKYSIHETKFGKRLKTLSVNDQDEAEATDGGTYKVTQQRDDALLTANAGEHPRTCICTNCMIGSEDWSFQDPYERETLIDIEGEIMKFIKTNGLDGIDLATAERKRRQIERSNLSKPEMKFGEKLVEDILDTLPGIRGGKTTLGVCKKVYSIPIVSRNRKWNGSIPAYATKEALDSFNPQVMKNSSKQGFISRHDYWMSENWQTMPWCEKVTPKRQWNIICCDCNECKGCTHEFCISIRKENDEILAVQKRLEEANLDTRLSPLIYQSDNPESMYEGPAGPKRWQRHVLFTTKKVPDGHHVEWDSWKGVSFVKDKPVKPAKPADGPVSGFMINIMNENGMECPSWFRYGDAYEIVGLIYERKVANAKEALKERVALHEHMKTHDENSDFQICEGCDSIYLRFSEFTDEWGVVTPALQQVVMGVSEPHIPLGLVKDGLTKARNPGKLCDPQTGHLAFNVRKMAVPWRTTSHDEQGELTYKTYKVAIVGTSNVPEWRKKDFKPVVNEAIDWGIQQYGKTHLTIVSGGADGVDSIAEECCRERDIDFMAIKPEVEQWKDSFGKRGYRTRNTMIAKTVCKLYNFVQASTEEQGPKCKHCPGELHWRSGGCWTEETADKLGTETIKVIVP